MKILFAAAEVAPFSKAGGLSDVVGSLPKALEKDAEMAIFTPLHGSIDCDKWGIKELENSEMWITFGNAPHKFKLFMTQLPGTKINVFFVQNDWYFSCFKEVYPRNIDTRYEHERYIAFSLATLEYAKKLNFKADIIHSNDWHTAMIPLFIKANYKYNEPSDLEGIKSLRKPYSYKKQKNGVTEAQVYGAWMGRIAGCMLGKTVENIKSYELVPFLKESGNYPMHRYIYSTDVTKETIDKYEFDSTDQVITDSYNPDVGSAKSKVALSFKVKSSLASNAFSSSDLPAPKLT